MAFIPVYILILFGTIIIDYFAGIFIERVKQKQKRAFLVLSLVANIGALCVFKYYNFFIGNMEDFFSVIHIHANLPLLTILLPIGLSFHTFQAMSYTIEVYRGNQKAEKHFGIYALYVMFFPQLVAGPIERPQNLLHQFKEEHFFDYARIVSGLRLMGWGLFKKVVVADRLAVVVDKVYANPGSFNSISLLIAVIFYAFQIFCDFSGYSDIAVGSARVLGINLMQNFNNPFLSKSVTEFWRRWHISLSTWLKDYLYTSLVVEKGIWENGELFLR
jgi:D-alanyl-lipoteichoic acid acyltransferase DltB (MBOAT superfamily)